MPKSVLTIALSAPHPLVALPVLLDVLGKSFDGLVEELTSRKLGNSLEFFVSVVRVLTIGCTSVHYRQQAQAALDELEHQLIGNTSESRLAGTIDGWLSGSPEWISRAFSECPAVATILAKALAVQQNSWYSVATALSCLGGPASAGIPAAGSTARSHAAFCDASLGAVRSMNVVDNVARLWRCAGLPSAADLNERLCLFLRRTLTGFNCKVIQWNQLHWFTVFAVTSVQGSWSQELVLLLCDLVGVLAQRLMAPEGTSTNPPCRSSLDVWIDDTGAHRPRSASFRPTSSRGRLGDAGSAVSLSDADRQMLTETLVRLSRTIVEQTALADDLSLHSSGFLGAVLSHPLWEFLSSLPISSPTLVIDRDACAALLLLLMQHAVELAAAASLQGTAAAFLVVLGANNEGANAPKVLRYGMRLLRNVLDAVPVDKISPVVRLPLLSFISAAAQYSAIRTTRASASMFVAPTATQRAELRLRSVVDDSETGEFAENILEVQVVLSTLASAVSELDETDVAVECYEDVSRFATAAAHVFWHFIVAADDGEPLDRRTRLLVSSDDCDQEGAALVSQALLRLVAACSGRINDRIAPVLTLLMKACTIMYHVVDLDEVQPSGETAIQCHLVTLWSLARELLATSSSTAVESLPSPGGVVEELVNAVEVCLTTVLHQQRFNLCVANLFRTVVDDVVMWLGGPLTDSASFRRLEFALTLTKVLLSDYGNTSLVPLDAAAAVVMQLVGGTAQTLKHLMTDGCPAAPSAKRRASHAFAAAMQTISAVVATETRSRSPLLEVFPTFVPQVRALLEISTRGVDEPALRFLTQAVLPHAPVEVVLPSHWVRGLKTLLLASLSVDDGQVAVRLGGVCTILSIWLRNAKVVGSVFDKQLMTLVRDVIGNPETLQSIARMHATRLRAASWGACMDVERLCCGVISRMLRCCDQTPVGVAWFLDICASLPDASDRTSMLILTELAAIFHDDSEPVRSGVLTYLGKHGASPRCVEFNGSVGVGADLALPCTLAELARLPDSGEPIPFATLSRAAQESEGTLAEEMVPWVARRVRDLLGHYPVRLDAPPHVEQLISCLERLLSAIPTDARPTFFNEMVSQVLHCSSAPSAYSCCGALWRDAAFAYPLVDQICERMRRELRCTAESRHNVISKLLSAEAGYDPDGRVRRCWFMLMGTALVDDAH